MSTSVLARLLQTRVANLGVSAYGPQQALIVLKRHALPLRPRGIVWAFWEGNDLRDTSAYDAMHRSPLQQWTARSPGRGSVALMRMFKKCREAPNIFTSGVFRTESGGDVEMQFFMSRRWRNDTWSAEDEQVLRRIGEALAEANEVTPARGSRWLFCSFRRQPDLSLKSNLLRVGRRSGDELYSMVIVKFVEV